MDISLYCMVITKYGSNDKRQLIVDLDIVKYLCAGNLVFQHVSTPAFKDLLLALHPAIIIKAPSTYSRNKLPILYSNIVEAVQNVLRSDLKDVEAVGSPSDLWSSKNNEAFGLKTLLLKCIAFPEQHTADNIVNKTIALISALPFNTGCEMTSVTDSGENMLSGIKKSVKIDESFSCIAHLLHLVMVDTVKEVKDVEKVFKVCMALSAHKSTISQRRIVEACKDVLQNKIKFHKIISPCKTRWNSGLMCMDSILHLQSAQEIIACSNLITDDFLRALNRSTDQFEVIEKIVLILQFFNEFTEAVSSEKNPTSRIVIPGLFDIQEKIKKMIRPNDKLTANFISRLLSNLNKRFPDCGSGRKINALAHLVDPKFKGLLLTRIGKDDATLRDLKESSIGKYASNLNETKILSTELSHEQDLSPTEQVLFEMMGKDSNAATLYRS
ncbi:uncharacterized protein LOC136078122 [Hydra vulgaris]|uniref:Uncharacterized protein LOC136078122 n=1 Tax=Hydra vulgaris TaxID=6087 RepID=A0ABM4BJG5_HYDVU